MQQYLREWLFTIIPLTWAEDGTYKENISKSKSFSSLRIVFDFKNTMLGDPTTGYFQLFNVGQSTKDLLAGSKCLIKMEIGYSGNKKRLLFSGEVSNSYQIRQGTDTVQLIWARDSGNVLKDFTMDFRSNSTEKTPYELISNIVAEAPTLTSEISFIGSAATVLKEADTIDNYTNIGNVKKLLDDLTKPYQLTWQCHFGEIIILSEEDSVKVQDGDSSPYTVSINTGLLARPIVDYVGVSFKHLLNTRFVPGKLIKVKKITAQTSFGNEFYVPVDNARAALDSTYRIVEVQQKGDTRGINWYSNVKAYTKVGE